MPDLSCLSHAASWPVGTPMQQGMKQECLCQNIRTVNHFTCHILCYVWRNGRRIDERIDNALSLVAAAQRCAAAVVVAVVAADKLKKERKIIEMWVIMRHKSLRWGGSTKYTNILLKGPCINRAPPVIELQKCASCQSVMKIMKCLTVLNFAIWLSANVATRCQILGVKMYIHCVQKKTPTHIFFHMMWCADLSKNCSEYT